MAIKHRPFADTIPTHNSVAAALIAATQRIQFSSIAYAIGATILAIILGIGWLISATKPPIVEGYFVTKDGSELAVVQMQQLSSNPDLLRAVTMYRLDKVVEAAYSFPDPQKANELIQVDFSPYVAATAVASGAMNDYRNKVVIPATQGNEKVNVIAAPPTFLDSNRYLVTWTMQFLSADGRVVDTRNDHAVLTVAYVPRTARNPDGVVVTAFAYGQNR